MQTSAQSLMAMTLMFRDFYKQKPARPWTVNGLHCPPEANQSTPTVVFPAFIVKARWPATLHIVQSSSSRKTEIYGTNVTTIKICN